MQNTSLKSEIPKLPGCMLIQSRTNALHSQTRVVSLFSLIQLSQDFKVSNRGPLKRKIPVQINTVSVFLKLSLKTLAF